MGGTAIPIERRERNLNSWEEFEEQLRDIRKQVKSQLFFRGQSNSTWPLSSTLDREPCGARTLFKDYYHSERAKVLKRLDQHNLNAFSLFGSEESLMDTMALRTWHFGEDSIPEEEKREMAADLAEVKAEAAKRGYTRIKRDVDKAPWVPLESWRGFSGGTNTPHYTVQVEYWLEGDKVRVTRALDDQEYRYTLS